MVNDISISFLLRILSDTIATSCCVCLVFDYFLYVYFLTCGLFYLFVSEKNSSASYASENQGEDGGESL